MQPVFLKSKTLEEKFIEYSHLCLEGGYKLDDENLIQFGQIMSEIKEGSCVIIQGNTGSGKSLIFRILQKIIHPKSKLYFTFFSCQDIVRDFNMYGHEIFTIHKNKNIVFDDLGFEDRGIHFGDKVEVMEKFIAQRYDLFCYDNKITHFTTNLTKKEIEARYGIRSMSRLNEMCSFTILGTGNHTDRRTLKNLKSFPNVYHAEFKTEDEKKWEENYKKFKEEQKNSPPQPVNRIGIGAQLKRVLGNL